MTRSRTWIVVALLIVAAAGCSMALHPEDPSRASLTTKQQRAPFRQDPKKIDLAEEAVARARKVVLAEEGHTATYTFECVHDFWAPFELADFAPKGGRVFVVKVGGYDTKDAEGVINAFIWVNEAGKTVWEP